MEYAVMTKEEQKMEHVIHRAADNLTLLQNIALIAGEYHLGKYVSRPRSCHDRPDISSHM